MNALERLFPSPITRRDFVSRMAIAGLGAGAMSYLASTAHAAQENQGIPDPQNLPGIPGASKDQAVLNCALTLEILEADLYRQALNHASGGDPAAPLDASTSGCKLQIRSGQLNQKAAQAGFTCLVNFAGAEGSHRDFLRSAIESQGGQPLMA